jgi:hypothetical protein
MRRVALVLAITLLAGSVQAADAPVKHPFGNAICAKNIPCGSSYAEDNTDASNIIALSSSCIARYFGLRDGAAYFEESRGLDSNRCLTTKPPAQTGAKVLTMVPQCCLVPMEGVEGMCQLNCDQYGVH